MVRVDRSGFDDGDSRERDDGFGDRRVDVHLHDDQVVIEQHPRHDQHNVDHRGQSCNAEFPHHDQDQGQLANDRNPTQIATDLYLSEWDFVRVVAQAGGPAASWMVAEWCCPFVAVHSIVTWSPG